MPSGPKKRKNAKKKKETALHVGSPTNIPEEVGSDEVKVVLEKSGGVVLGRDDDRNDEDASWNSMQKNTDGSNSTIEEYPCLRSRDSIDETAEAVEVLKMDKNGDGVEEATVITQGLEGKKDDAVDEVERVEDGEISVESVEPPKVDDEKGGSSGSGSSSSSSSSSSDDGGSDSDRDNESEKQEVLPGALKEAETLEVLSGVPEESEKPEILSGALEESEKPELLSEVMKESEKAEFLSGDPDDSEKAEVLSDALENFEASEVLSGAPEEPKKLELLPTAPKVAEAACIPIESSGLESIIEVETVTTVESVIIADATASSIESERDVTVKGTDDPGLENSIESAREEITETLAMSSSTEVHQEVEQQITIAYATPHPIVEPYKHNEKSKKTEIERSLPPPIIQRTSWKGCCGLFDAFLGSKR